MGLILNLHGAVQQLKNSRSKTKAIDTVNRLTEEFYRTIGSLFYARYSASRLRSGQELAKEVENHISEYMAKPTFDSWMRLGEICAKHLVLEKDRFANDYDRVVKQPLDTNLGSKAKDVLREIQKLRSIDKYSPPKKVKPGHVLELVRNLRNYRAHAWDSEETLQPLIDAGIKDLVPNLIKALMDIVDVQILIPIAISKKGVEVIITDGLDRSTETLVIPPSSNVHLEACYIQFYDDEPPFQYITDLVSYDEKNNFCFVYREFLGSDKTDPNFAVYQVVPKQGKIERKKREVEHSRTPFGLEKIALPLEDKRVVTTHTQRDELSTSYPSEIEVPETSMVSLTAEERAIDNAKNIYRLFADLRKGSAGVVAGSQLTRTQKILHTETSTDRNFWSMLEKENPDLVIISGNAGDGKSTLMRMLTRKKGDIINGRVIEWNFDATHSRSRKEKQVDTLVDYFSNFSNSLVSKRPDNMYVIAMNTGMALSFFEEAKRMREEDPSVPSFLALERSVKSMMDIPGKYPRPEISWKIILIDLGKRALFNLNADDQSSSLISELVAKLVNLQFWKFCPSCSMYEKCFIAANIELLRTPSVVRFLEYLIMRASYLTNSHFTIRDFWEFISEATGGRSWLHYRETRTSSSAEKTCISFIETLVDSQFHGDLLASLIYNSPFQEDLFYSEKHGRMFAAIEEAMMESFPDDFSRYLEPEAVLYDDLNNGWARGQHPTDTPRIMRATVAHDPASLTGFRIDVFAESLASILLGPPSKEITGFMDGLLPQERFILNPYVFVLEKLSDLSTDPDLHRATAEWIPQMIKSIAGTLVSVFKRRSLFLCDEGTDSTTAFDEYYSHDYVTSFIQEVIIPARTYVLIGRTDEREKQKLVNHLLADLLPRAIMLSEGLGLRDLSNLDSDSFYISLNPRLIEGELAKFVAATKITILPRNCDIHLGRPYEKHVGCMTTIKEYNLFDPVPMEIYVDLVIFGNKHTKFKIDTATYGFLRGIVVGKQPSLVDDVRYRNFSIIKKKIRELAHDRSQTVFYNPYGSRVMRLGRGSWKDWKITTGG